MGSGSTELDFQNGLQQDLFDRLAPAQFLAAEADRSAAAAAADRKSFAKQFSDALANSLDYPPLNQTVFAGDKVAIALQTGLPQPVAMLTTLLEQLKRAEIAGEDIVVVVSPVTAGLLGMSADQLETATQATDNEAPQMVALKIGEFEVNVMVHNVSTPAAVAYLAANEAGDPIYLNRYLVDADVVLPLGHALSRREDLQDTLYPEFSTAQTQTRFDSGELTREVLAQEIQLANDTLGSFYSIKAVAGPGGQIERVLAGSRPAVQTQSLQAADEIWIYRGPTNCGLVLATIESTPSKATWDDFVQAVITADQIAGPASPIIIWSDLAGKPGKTIRQALSNQFEKASHKKLTPPLIQLLEILQQHPVYLRSQLSRDEVEALGIGHIDSAAQVNRIGENRDAGVVLRDAHKYSFQEITKNHHAAGKPRRRKPGSVND